MIIFNLITVGIILVATVLIHEEYRAIEDKIEYVEEVVNRIETKVDKIYKVNKMYEDDLK